MAGCVSSSSDAALCAGGVELAECASGMAVAVVLRRITHTNCYGNLFSATRLMVYSTKDTYSVIRDEVCSCST